MAEQQVAGRVIVADGLGGGVVQLLGGVVARRPVRIVCSNRVRIKVPVAQIALIGARCARLERPLV